MDKKDFLAIANKIVEAVAAKNGLSEGEARALVGLTLRGSSEAIVNACEIRQVVLTNSEPAKTEA